jgi:hypothetical protein
MPSVACASTSFAEFGSINPMVLTAGSSFFGSVQLRDEFHNAILDKSLVEVDVFKRPLQVSFTRLSGNTMIYSVFSNVSGQFIFTVFVRHQSESTAFFSSSVSVMAQHAVLSSSTIVSLTLVTAGIPFSVFITARDKFFNVISANTSQFSCFTSIFPQQLSSPQIFPFETPVIQLNRSLSFSFVVTSSGVYELNCSLRQQVHRVGFFVTVAAVPTMNSPIFQCQNCHNLTAGSSISF